MAESVMGSRVLYWLNGIGCLLLIVAETQIIGGWSDGGVGIPTPGVRLARGLMLLLTIGPLALRRRHSLIVVGAICSAMVFQLLVVTPSLPFLGALLPMAIANYTAGAYAKRWPAVALALTVSTELVVYAVIPEERVQGELLFSLFTIVGTWLAGYVVRTRLVRADVEVRSVQERVELRSAAALAQERALIARELHDVIAHSVSVMGVQAGAARTLLDQGSTAASRDAILAVESTARTSVAELQRLMSVLRVEASAAHERAPQPGLGMLPAVVEQVRAAGLPVMLGMAPLPALPAGLDLAVFRILQESLTNALKQAAAATTVTIGHESGHLQLAVRNAPGFGGTQRYAGSPGEEPVGGNGLIGIRERVQLYGGTLQAGPLPNGGFVVQVSLPFKADLEPLPR